MRRLTRVAAVLVALWLAAGMSGCGNGTSAKRTSAAAGVAPAHTGAREKLSGGLRGGTLTVYDHADFAHLDPGEAYSALDNEVVLATQRPLFSYRPNETQTLSPDLASGPAIVSPDGRTVTVHIRHGVHFSPPVNREVTSGDVAYAIERGANPNVATPYFSAYFFVLVGADKATGAPIPGIVTPDKYTIVFHLTGSYGTFFADALSLPLTAPVPKEFAAALDAQRPARYGSTAEVSTGPYMLEADRSGTFLGRGYRPGLSATLVRNPNWTPSTDRRPAYLNRIDIRIGGDPNVIGRQVLNGSAAVANDQLAAPTIKLAYQHYFDQLVAVPGTGLYYVALNNRRGPFANVDARRAVWAALDRTAMLKANGGPVTAQLGTHFLYPGTDGYTLAGGDRGPAAPYNTHPAGDMALATRYMKAAGYPSGRYSGSATVLVVGASGDPYSGPAQVVNQTLQNLGFRTRFTLVDQAAMFTKFCGTPSQEIDVCPSVGWTRDFADPQTVLDPTFAGYNIAAGGDSNFGQVNDAHINAAMRAAETVIGASARARAWARIDRMLVDIAAAVPWAFLNNPTIESRNVRGINDISNAGFWDYAYTSLK